MEEHVQMLIHVSNGVLVHKNVFNLTNIINVLATQVIYFKMMDLHAKAQVSN